MNSIGRLSIINFSKKEMEQPKIPSMSSAKKSDSVRIHSDVSAVGEGKDEQKYEFQLDHPFF